MGQQDQGRYPTTPPGNGSAGPSGSQQSAQEIARKDPALLGNGAAHDEASPRLTPAG